MAEVVPLSAAQQTCMFADVHDPALPASQFVLAQQAELDMHELVAAQIDCPGGQAHVPPGVGHTSPLTLQSPLLQQVPLGMQLCEAMHTVWPASQASTPPLLLPLPPLLPLPLLLPPELPFPEPLPELPPEPELVEPELLPDPEPLPEPLRVQTDP